MIFIDKLEARGKNFGLQNPLGFTNCVTQNQKNECTHF